MVFCGAKIIIFFGFPIMFDKKYSFFMHFFDFWPLMIEIRAEGACTLCLVKTYEFSIKKKSSPKLGEVPVRAVGSVS